MDNLFEVSLQEEVEITFQIKDLDRMMTVVLSHPGDASPIAGDHRYPGKTRHDGCAGIFEGFLDFFGRPLHSEIRKIRSYQPPMTVNHVALRTFPTPEEESFPRRHVSRYVFIDGRGVEAANKRDHLPDLSVRQRKWRHLRSFNAFLDHIKDLLVRHVADSADGIRQSRPPPSLPCGSVTSGTGGPINLSPGGDGGFVFTQRVFDFLAFLFLLRQRPQLQR